MGGSVVGTVIVGLALAMLMRSAYGIVRIIVGGVVVVAWMMPAVTAGMTWYASTTSGGTFATLFHTSGTDFLHSSPLLIVTLANTWSQCGFAMLVLAASLRNIPAEMLEAATLENASACSASGGSSCPCSGRRSSPWCCWSRSSRLPTSPSFTS